MKEKGYFIFIFVCVYVCVHDLKEKFREQISEQKHCNGTPEKKKKKRKEKRRLLFFSFFLNQEVFWEFWWQNELRYCSANNDTVKVTDTSGVVLFRCYFGRLKKRRVEGDGGGGGMTGHVS